MIPAPEHPAGYRTDELAMHLGVSTKTVLRWSKRKSMGLKPIPGRVKIFTPNTVAAFLNR
jgi:transposase